jgi:ankyrin repeat protein
MIEFPDITFDNKISPLLAACYIGKYETVTLLLFNDKIDVNLASFYRGNLDVYSGYTPLMLASFRGYYEILRILLERKADVNKTNSQGILMIT